MAAVVVVEAIAGSEVDAEESVAGGRVDERRAEGRGLTDVAVFTFALPLALDNATPLILETGLLSLSPLVLSSLDKPEPATPDTLRSRAFLGTTFFLGLGSAGINISPSPNTKLITVSSSSSSSFSSPSLPSPPSPSRPCVGPKDFERLANPLRPSSPSDLSYCGGERSPMERTLEGVNLEGPEQ